MPRAKHSNYKKKLKVVLLSILDMQSETLYRIDILLFKEVLIGSRGRKAIRHKTCNSGLYKHTHN